MSDLAFLSNYQRIRQQFYAPRQPIAPRVKPNWTVAYVYAFPIGPVIPAEWKLASISEAMERAHEILDSHVILNVPRNKGSLIVKEVCAKHAVSLEDLISERRTANIVRPRQEAMYRLCTETDWSLPRIGRFLGGRDHTTVLHGRRAFEKRLKSGEVTL